MKISSYTVSFLFLLFATALQASIIPHYNPKAKLSYDLVPYCKNKLCGYVDRQGNLKIKADYEGLSFFNTAGFAQFKKYGLYGVIDRSGKEIVSAFSTKPLSLAVNITNAKQDTIENAYFAINLKAEEWKYFVEKSNPLVTSSYYAADEKHEYKVSDSYYTKWSSPYFYEGIRRTVSNKRTCNFIDIDGNTLLKTNIAYGAPSKNAIYVVDEKDKLGAIDLTGKTIIQNDYSYLEHQDKYGYTVVSTNSKRGLLDKNYKLVVDTSLISIRAVSEDKFIISRERNVWELVDISLKPIFTKGYTRIKSYLNNLFIVEDNDQHYLLNEKEEILAGPFTSIIQPHKSTEDSQYLFTKTDNSLTIIDNTGKTIFSGDKNYTPRLGVIPTHYILHNREHGSKLIDNSGKVLLGPAMQTIQATDFEDCYLVKNNNQMGLYSASKEWVIPLGNYEITKYSQSGSDERRIRVTTSEEIIEYTGSLSNKTIEPNNYSNWGANKNINKGFIEINFIDGRQAIFPKDKKSSVKYTSKHAYMVKRFDTKKTLVYDENLSPILPEGYTLWRDETLQAEVYFIVTNAQRESALVDMEGNWIFPPKPKQQINLIEDTFWAVGPDKEKHVYNKNFEQLTTKAYSGFKKAKTGLIVAYNADKSLDILDASGKIISEGQYTNLVRNEDEYLVLEKSQDNAIRSCQIDGNGKELACYPYADFYIAENTNYIIAKDLHDFGIVDMQGKEKIPFKYKTISYYEEIQTYMCRKDDYSSDLYDKNFNPIGPGYQSLYKSEKVGEDYYFIKGSNKTAIFNANGEYLGTTDNKLHGTIATRKKHYHKQGLLWLYNRDMGSCFFDAHNKKALLPKP